MLYFSAGFVHFVVAIVVVPMVRFIYCFYYLVWSWYVSYSSLIDRRMVCSVGALFLLRWYLAVYASIILIFSGWYPRSCYPWTD